MNKEDSTVSCGAYQIVNSEEERFQSSNSLQLEIEKMSKA